MLPYEDLREIAALRSHLVARLESDVTLEVEQETRGATTFSIYNDFCDHR